MLIAAGIVALWVMVAIGLHWKRREFYRKRPWAWNQRKQGLLSFSDREVFWMTNLWPLTVVAIIVYALICWGCQAIEWFTDLKKNR